MKPQRRSRTFREFIGTLKFVGWIAALVLAVIVLGQIFGYGRGFT